MLLPSQTSAAAVNFKDVSSGHWAKGAIDWGTKNGVVAGYTDNTFRPSNNVTEAEFLAMFIRAFDTMKSPSKVTHWADPAYTYATAKNWPVLGANSRADRDRVITRGDVAEIIAGSQGLNVSQTDAVQFLLNENLSAGKTGATVDGYKPNDKITRAETVVFIKRLKDAGVKELNSRPSIPGGSVEEKPAVNMTAETKKVADAMDKAIANNTKYVGMEVKKASSDITAVYTSNNDALASYTDNGSKDKYDNISVFKAKDANARSVVYVMLEALGVKVTDEIRNAIEEAPTAKVAKETIIDNSNVEIIITPHKTNPNRINIDVWVK